jgi:tetratricopeptide (TPR) repeat protein
MRQSNSHRPVNGLKLALQTLVLIGLVASAAAQAGDDPAVAAATRPRFALGSEVILKLPGLPIFDQDRAISAGDNLTFMVERSEAGRLLLVSRDQKTRGWAYEDEVVSFEQAADYVGQVVVNDVKDAASFWVLGRLWFYLNDDQRALANLNQAIRLPSSQPAFYLSRSLVRLRKKDLRGALNDCETFIRLEPDRAQGPFVREQIQLARTDHAAAMTALEQAFRLDCANPFPRGTAGASVAVPPEPVSPGAGDASSFQKSSARSRPEPQTAAQWVASGETWCAAQEYNRAIDDYNAALKLDPRYAPAYTSRARAWMLKHYRDRAIADYDEAIKLEPANAMYLVGRAEAWSARGMHEPAMADYAQALHLEPNNPAIWVSRGNEWRKDLKIEAAIADYNQAIRLDPKYSPAYVARGNTWKQVGRFDLAIQGFSDLVRINPQEPVAHQMLARILATAQLDHSRNGKWAVDEATRACELAHWIDPDSLDTLAAASAEVGDFESAVRWQTLAIKLVRQRYPSALQKKAISSGGGRAGVGFDDRLAFYKGKKPIRE